MNIVLIIPVSPKVEEGNYLKLGNELLRRGNTVSCCFMDSIAMAADKVVAHGFQLHQPLQVDDEFPANNVLILDDADVVWTLTLGMRHSFLDKIQLLKCLEDRCQMINSVEALIHLKSKYFLASHSNIFQYPETYASTNPVELAQIIQQGGGKWIAKPPAGSLGRDIFLLEDGDPNLRVILETMTGPDSDQFCLLQSYVEEIEQGEKRVLFAGGKPVGQYLRRPSTDHRTNVSSGADTELCDLTPAERAYCEAIGQFLMSQGATFVGLDLAYPWVIEFNVVTPGGIQTIIDLGGEDMSSRIISEIFP